MSDEPREPRPPAPEPALVVDAAGRRRLLAALGGNQLRFCYQCGACVGDCPSARFHPGFNPREIMLRALLGALDGLLAPDSILWRCSNCYTCYERCPQDVRPVEVILALKNLARQDGSAPDEVRAAYETIRTTGRSAPVLEGVRTRRARMGLPPIEPVDTDEIARLLAPETPEEGA
jgi:heterodisulfide reductase subunit C